MSRRYPKPVSAFGTAMRWSSSRTAFRSTGGFCRPGPRYRPIPWS